MFSARLNSFLFFPSLSPFQNGKPCDDIHVHQVSGFHVTKLLFKAVHDSDKKNNAVVDDFMHEVLFDSTTKC
jgi:hypothetical protein